MRQHPQPHLNSFRYHLIVCLGVIGVATDILRQAQAVNTAKAALKKVCTPLQGIRMRVPVKGDAGPTKAIPVLRSVLAYRYRR
jgi:hypothetical protein